MTEMDDDSFAACKFLIKNMNWFNLRKQPYLVANYNTWAAKNGTSVDVIKNLVDAFSFAKLDQVVAIYFTYLKDNMNREESPLVFEPFEKKFLELKDDMEMLYENAELETVKIALLGVTEEKKEIEKVTEAVKNLKITLKILMENLTGTEDDVEDWFERFEIRSNAVDWSDQVKGIRLPAYLSDFALVVWKTQNATAKIDYIASKKLILKETVDESTLEQKFYGRKQKDCETVLEYYYKLSNDAEKIFENTERKTVNILKVFWNGLLFKIRKMVVGSGNPLCIEVALEVAKNAERFLKESEEKPDKLITAVNSKSPERSRERENFQGKDRRAQSPSPRRDFQTNKPRSSTPFNGRESVKCYNCSKDGHYARDCKEAKRMRGSCYYCKEEGHHIEKCYARIKKEQKNSLKD
jgi:hypothetical protein